MLEGMQLGCDPERRAKDILCMQDLRKIFHQLVLKCSLRHVPGTDVPQLQASVTTTDEDFVQVCGRV